MMLSKFTTLKHSPSRFPTRQTRSFRSSSKILQKTESQPPINSSEEHTTHFGFQTVPEKLKSALVGNVFKSVANNYDLMNDLMSGGVHRVWKSEFIDILNPTPGTALLDVAGGTGDIAFRFIEAVKSSPLYVKPYHNTTNTKAAPNPTKVLVCDINPAMLEVGKKRALENGYSETDDPSISWMVGDAENLHQVPDNSMDAYTIAFGIRNCTHVDKVLREAHRVLKKGGRFLCLEFSHIETPVGILNPVVQSVYDFYSFNVIPTIGEIVAKDRASYQYLVESIRKFPTQENFCHMMEEAGFSMVSYKNLTFGVVAVHSGFKL